MKIRKKRIILVYTMTLVGIVLWIGAILTAPYLKSKSLPISSFLYTTFSPTCHQIPSRCFLLFGYPLAVCARCLGIYIGFLIGVLTYPFIRGFGILRLPRTLSFILITIPIVVDTIGNIFGIWESPSELRFCLGILWGIILPFYFITGLAELALRKKPKPNQARHGISS